MSTDSKPSKPMPSADEINAYLEASAARTKLRLPLAKGSTPPGSAAPAAAGGAARALPVSNGKKLPTRREEAPTAPGTDGSEAARGEVWRPFSPDEER